MSHDSTPRSYIIESQGRSYRRNRQHIRPLNPIITRPSPVKQPDSYTNTVITRPSPTEHQLSSHINPAITRPSPASAAEQQSDSHTKPNISGPSATTESLPNTKQPFQDHQRQNRYQHLDVNSLQDHQNKTKGTQLQLTSIKYYHI